jgi:hypothetical protein
VIDLQIRDLGFTAALEAAIVGIPEYVSQQFGRWTMRVFYDLVYNTPQWSGDLAANWNYSVALPDGTYRPIYRKALSWASSPAGDRMEPLQRGDMAAVWAAMGRAEDSPSPRYDQKVYFTNNTPIAPDVETNSIYIRPINLVNGAVQMASFTAAKWRNLPV